MREGDGHHVIGNLGDAGQQGSGQDLEVGTHLHDQPCHDQPINQAVRMVGHHHNGPGLWDQGNLFGRGRHPDVHDIQGTLPELQPARRPHTLKLPDQPQKRQLAGAPFDHPDGRRLARIGKGAGIGKTPLVIGAIVGIADQTRLVCTVSQRSSSSTTADGAGPDLGSERFPETACDQVLKGVGKLFSLGSTGSDLNRGSARGCQHQKTHDRIPRHRHAVFGHLCRSVISLDHLDKPCGRAGVKALFVHDLKVPFRQGRPVIQNHARPRRNCRYISDLLQGRFPRRQER